MFSQSDTAKTMAEISRIDPQFNKDSFLKECEFEIIPSVLEVSCTEQRPCIGQLYKKMSSGAQELRECRTQGGGVFEVKISKYIDNLCVCAKKHCLVRWSLITCNECSHQPSQVVFFSSVLV